MNLEGVSAAAATSKTSQEYEIVTCKKERPASGCRFIPLRKHSGHEENGLEVGSSTGQVSNSEERTRKEFSQVLQSFDMPFHNPATKPLSLMTSDGTSVKVLAQELFEGPLQNKVLRFGRPPLQPVVPVAAFQTNLRESYLANCNAAAAGRRTRRYISQSPERILDAPELVNDFYLNLLDWSCDNILAGDTLHCTLRRVRGVFNYAADIFVPSRSI